MSIATTETTQPDTTASDLAVITRRVSSIDLETPFDEAINTLGLIAALKKRLDELRREALAVAVEQLQTTGGKYIGETAYWAAPDRDHKPEDVKAIYNAILECAEGDESVMLDCLCSDPFKPAACRKVFEKAGKPELFGKLFKTVEKWDVRDGKKIPKLQSFNPAFAR